MCFLNVLYILSGRCAVLLGMINSPPLDDLSIRTVPSLHRVSTLLSDPLLQYSPYLYVGGEGSGSPVLS